MSLWATFIASNNAIATLLGQLEGYVVLCMIGDDDQHYRLHGAKESVFIAERIIGSGPKEEDENGFKCEQLFCISLLLRCG